MDTPPPFRPRPRLDRWLRDHDMDTREAGRRLGCSHEYVRRICLPFDDPERAVPGKQLMCRIVQVTNGAVRPADFYPPVEDMLRGKAA